MVTKLNFKNYLSTALIALVMWACSGGGGDSPTPGPADTGKDRKEMLSNWADNIVIPSYAAFKVKLDLMVAKSEAFSVKPDVTTLTDFRSAWVDAYTEWQKNELFDFGPGFKRAIRSYYNIYPTSVSGIEANINNPSVNLEVTSSFDKQGFPALDYLLNGVGATDTEIVAYYTAQTEGAKRLVYIKSVTDHMQLLLNGVISDWNGTYHEEFISKTGVDNGAPMSELVNYYVLNYERYIRSGKFGIPSGAMLDGIVAAEKVEAFYKKDISKVLAQTAHQASIDFFNGKSFKTGTEGASLKSYLNALDAKDASSGKLLSDMINTQFAASKTKIDALEPDFYQEVKTNNQAMKDVYTELQKAVRMLKVDMTSAMSITITYTDNDGD